MRSRHLVTALAEGSLAAVGAAGCGGDDALTEEEFLSQGNEICASGDEAINAAAEEAFAEQPSADEEEAFITDTVIPETQQQIDDLSDLEAPEELQDQVDTLVSDAREELDAIEADPSSITQDSFVEVQAQADEIGLNECGSDSG